MPAAIKLQAEMGDQLQVIFVESQGATPLEAEKFALDRKWMGSRAMWTTQAPFNTGLGGLPSCALISGSGEVLRVGMNSSIMGKVHGDIEALAKSSKKFPKTLSKELKKAWTANAKGKIAEALQLLTELKAGEGELATAAAELSQSIQGKVESRFKAIGWMQENGFPLQALDALDGLVDDVKDHPQYTERASFQVSSLEGEAMEPEIDAAKALAKIEKLIAKDGSDPKLAKKLDKLANKFPGTRVAERAKKLSELMNM